MKINAIIILAIPLIAILVSCSPSTASPIATVLPTLSFTVTPRIARPSVTSTPQVIVPDPISFSGKGKEVLTVNKWRGPALIHINYEGTGEFTAWNLDQNQNLLNFVLITNGNYAGTQILDFSDSPALQTYFLEINATGNWEIQILPFEHGRRGNIPSVIDGTNNDVIFLEGGTPSSVEVSVYEPGHSYVLSGIDSKGIVQISNGATPYHGVAKIENGVNILIIECVGKWKLSVMN